MTFCIKFLSERVPNLKRGEKAAYGMLKIGDFEERFISSLSFWNADNYQHHWKEALTRLQNKEGATSCLITSLTDPDNTNFITLWPIYRERNSVFFQNQLLFLKGLKKPFNPAFPYDHVNHRDTSKEDGQKASEWCVSMDCIKSFLKMETL